MTKTVAQLEALLDKHLHLLHRGKVRNSYRLQSGYRLVFVTGRRSAFDFKLGFEIPGQAETLVALNIAARLELRNKLGEEFQHDLLAYGRDIDSYLPRELQDIPELQQLCTVVKDLHIVPIELVSRAVVVLKSTAFEPYKKGELLCGHSLPAGLLDGAFIPNGPISTPTIKAHVGHDLPLNYKLVEHLYPGFQAESLEIFNILQRYTRVRGILLVDDKKEAQWLPFGHRVTWGDEICTTDSSRFIPTDVYNDVVVKQGKPLPSFRDKQILRNDLMKVDISRFGLQEKVGVAHLDPTDPAHIQFVHDLPLSEEVREEMQAANNEVVQKLSTGLTLLQFQREVMGIRF